MKKIARLGIVGFILFSLLSISGCAPSVDRFIDKFEHFVEKWESADRHKITSTDWYDSKDECMKYIAQYELELKDKHTSNSDAKMTLLCDRYMAELKEAASYYKAPILLKDNDAILRWTTPVEEEDIVEIIENTAYAFTKSILDFSYAITSDIATMSEMQVERTMDEIEAMEDELDDYIDHLIDNDASEAMIEEYEQQLDRLDSLWEECDEAWDAY